MAGGYEVKEYPLISRDTGRDLTEMNPYLMEMRVINTIAQFCEHSRDAWTTNPRARAMVLSHLIVDHGMHGPDLESFLNDCDYSHIWSQMNGEEDQVGLLYKRESL
jgi:hypothetical protein